MKELVRNSQYDETYAWGKYAGRGYPIAQYHLACWRFDVWRAEFGGEIPLDLFSKAGREGHLPSIYNEGICHYYGKQLLLAEESFTRQWQEATLRQKLHHLLSTQIWKKNQFARNMKRWAWLAT